MVSLLSQTINNKRYEESIIINSTHFSMPDGWRTDADITIDNQKSVSRGLHCTGSGIINATNVNITTRSETSSTVATDRRGGTVTVRGGTISETSGISEIANSQSSNSQPIYILDGRRATDSMKGIVIQNGKKIIRK